METRKAKKMASGPSCYEGVHNIVKHQAPDAVDHKLNDIRRCDMDSRSDTCCAGNNWRLLSMTRQLCDVKGFKNSYKTTTNVQVGRATTLVVHDNGTVCILILSELLFFGKSMDQSLIKPNQIK